MKTTVVRAEQFTKAVNKALAEAIEDITKVTDQAAKDSARGASSALKASAPAGGSYAAGWSRRARKDGAWGKSQVVFNRTDYQLVHLLEKPHDTGGGGHYPKKVNYTGTLARVEAEYTEKFMEEVLSKI